MNYRYTYNLNGVSYLVVVWDQPWTNNRQITSVQKLQNINASQGYAHTFGITDKNL
jgi:hypothetical protein